MKEASRSMEQRERGDRRQASAAAAAAVADEAQGGSTPVGSFWPTQGDPLGLMTCTNHSRPARQTYFAACANPGLVP